MLINGAGGWLNSRLKNVREAHNRLKRQQENENLDANDDSSFDLDLVEHELSDEEAEQMVEVLKSTIVSPQTLDAVMVNLASTRKYRHKMLLSKELDLKQEFPYFFTHPSLVGTCSGFLQIFGSLLQ